MKGINRRKLVADLRNLIRGVELVETAKESRSINELSSRRKKNDLASIDCFPYFSAWWLRFRETCLAYL